MGLAGDKSEELTAIPTAPRVPIRTDENIEDSDLAEHYANMIGTDGHEMNGSSNEGLVKVEIEPEVDDEDMEEAGELLETVTEVVANDPTPNSGKTVLGESFAGRV